MKKIILSAAFLSLGIFAFAQQTPQAGNDYKKAGHVQKLKQELNLTDAQVAQLKALHEQKVADHKQNMSKGTKEDRAKNKQENEAALQKILTPDQYKKFQDMKAERKAERKARHLAKKSEQTQTSK